MKKISLISLLLILSTLILTGCNQSPAKADETVSDSPTNTQEKVFQGTKGDFIQIDDNKITVAASDISDGNAHYFNTKLPDGSPVYFFIVKSPDGNLRAAANGCQVCGPALQGFHQEGDTMVCNTCGNSYPLNKIATEKGGCNPAPINPDLKIENGNITITLAQLNDIKQFFN
jgi:uncharacterized membrane protein